MVLRNGVKLAAHLISSYYGDLCSKVCECLLRRGPQTLAQVVQSTELSRENVVNCLRVLIHQNCVQAFSLTLEGGFREAERKITQYMAVFDNIINKSRSAKFKEIVSDELGAECLEIFEGLLQHGRLSMNQIVDRSLETAGNSDVHVTKENFRRLLNSRFVERCPDPEPDASPPPKDDTPAPKRGAKSVKVAEVRMTLEQRALEAAAPMEASRFFMEMDGPSKEKIEEKPESKKIGKKRKQDVLKSDDGVLDTAINKEVLWRVNFEEFVRRLRHKACISHVKTRINNEAAMVLSAMIGLTRFSDMGQKTESSDYLSTDAIFNEITKQGGLGMDKERIELALEQLGCQTSTGLDESYSIDLKGIIEMAQIEEVESVVLKRYGREAYRIFRLLSKAGRVVETDKISDTTFIDKKDNLKILYKLWKDNYVQMEKVFTGQKPAPILLWRVNKQSLWKHVLDEMFHGALNLRLRLAHEQERGKEVLLLPRDKLEGEQAKRYKHLHNAKVILETSLIDLDDSIILFQD